MLAALTAACVLLADGVTRGLWPAELQAVGLAMTVAYAAAGAAILGRRPSHTVGWLCLVIAGATAATQLVELYALRHAEGWQAAAWVQGWTFYLAYPGAFSFLLLLFPTGRLPSARWAAIAAVVVAGQVLRIAVAGFDPGPVSGHLSGRPLLLSTSAPVLPAAALFEGLSWALPMAGLAAAGTSVLARWRAAGSELRQQLRPLAAAAALAAIGAVAHFAADLWGGPAFPDLGAQLLAVTLAVGIPAAVGVAVLRYRLFETDVLVDRLAVYSILTLALAAIYVGVVGELGVLLRQRASLIASIAAIGFIALVFNRLRAAVQRGVSRLLFGYGPDPERALVEARENERRRLGRDLHDGLGPAVAAQTIKAGVARGLVDRDPAMARRLMEEVEADGQIVVAEVRRLASGLHPVAIDELGLAGAIRREAGRATGGPDVLLELPASMAALPRAVEVAAYRIAQEALANVRRHSGAGRCSVRLTVGRELRLEIEDDGIGLGHANRLGIGLQSMRERAEEVGGWCRVGPANPRGTRVSVGLPLAHAER